MHSLFFWLACLLVNVVALSSSKRHRDSNGLTAHLLLSAGPDPELELLPGIHSCKFVEHWPPVALRSAEDRKFCSSLGFGDLARYQHAVVLTDKGVFLPVYSSVPLSERSPTTTHAVIWMHGTTMNANKHFCDAMHLTQTRDAGSEADSHVLTIVPWFSDERVTLGQWAPEEGGDPSSVSACWGNQFARMMGVSDGTGAGPLGSFEALDSLIRDLQKDHEHFPVLERIVVTGFSSGCQSLQRWAVFSQALQPGFGRVRVTAVLGSCGSYLYLDGSRPGAKCLSLRDTHANHRCRDFGVPAAGCDTYDTYKYGLMLDARSSDGYFGKFSKSPAMLEEACNNFMHKDVRFLFGQHDTCSCNVAHYHNKRFGGFRNRGCFPDIGVTCGPNVHGGSSRGYGCCDTWPDGYRNNLAHSCEALLQGTNRLQRGLNFMGHLRDFYARRDKVYVPTFSIFSGAHNGTSAFTSDAFRAWAFGDSMQPQG